MVVGAFPLAKLGVLLVRQVSKPIAGYIKEGAKRSRTFRNYVCLPTAQFYHWAEIRWKLWTMGFAKPANVTPLNEELAVQLGADILGEVFIFGTASALLVAEYVRSAANTKAKEEAAEQRIKNLESKLIELDFMLEQQRAQLREAERSAFGSTIRNLKDKLLPSSSSSSSSQQPAMVNASTPTPPAGPTIITPSSSMSTSSTSSSTITSSKTSEEKSSNGKNNSGA